MLLVDDDATAKSPFYSCFGLQIFVSVSSRRRILYFIPLLSKRKETCASSYEYSFCGLFLKLNMISKQYIGTMFGTTRTCSISKKWVAGERFTFLALFAQSFETIRYFFATTQNKPTAWKKNKKIGNLKMRINFVQVTLSVSWSSQLSEVYIDVF